MKLEVILSDFSLALERFEESMLREASDDLVRAGCIQYFEFTIELAWKSIQAAANEQGLEPVRSPRSAFKVAFAQTWIVNLRIGTAKLLPGIANLRIGTAEPLPGIANLRIGTAKLLSGIANLRIGTAELLWHRQCPG